VPSGVEQQALERKRSIPLACMRAGAARCYAKLGVDEDYAKALQVWQNHLNYSGSSAQVIIIKATPAQCTLNGTILGLSGNVTIQPPDLGSNKHTPHEGESRDITTINFTTQA